MEWLDIGRSGGLLLGGLAVMAAIAFMYFFGKNLE
jgi:hypothetical protein